MTEAERIICKMYLDEYLPDHVKHEACNEYRLIMDAINAPETIHCKECKHWMRAYLDISGKFGCNVMRDYTAPNDYCFKAGRKE